jgi:hypothetical protein
MTMPKEKKKKKNQQKTWPLSIPKRGCLLTIVQVEHNLPERRKQKRRRENLEAPRDDPTDGREKNLGRVRSLALD